nr:chondroitin proteoglycan-2-like [Penaeus vannamei]
MPCAPGTVWNQQKLTCDHEWASPCVTGSYLTPEGLPCGGGSGGNGSEDGDSGSEGGGEGGNGGGDDGNGENGGGDGGEDCPLSCPEKEGLFPYPRDCKKWIHCSENIPFVKKCPSHLHFNPNNRVCDWPFRAQCIAAPDADCQIPEPVLPTEPPNVKPDICDCECCLRPHPEDCTAYYYCEPNASAKFHTCSEGLVFNPEFSQCVLQVDYPQCQPEKPPTCDPTCQCLYPAHSCSEYYKCNGDGIPVKYECTGGLYFNDQKHTCDLPENVSCEERRKRSEIDPVTEQHYILPEECKDLQGMYAIRDRPSSYYLCGHGVAFEMRCPDGGVFSSKAQTCILRK